MSLQKRNIEAYNNLRFKDLEVLLSLSQTLSIRELSRKTQLTPGQISKIIVKIEKSLNVKLFNRSTTGLSLSSEGKALLPKLKKIHNMFLDLQNEEHSKTKKKITIASSSFFISHLIPSVIAKFDDYQFNIIELPPEDYVQVGLRSAFSVCLHTGKLDWPSTWHSEFAGNITSKLFSSNKNPIQQKAKITKKDLESSSFVGPVYWTREGLKNGGDHFPKNIKRNILHRTSSALSCAHLIEKNNCIGFIPSLLAESIKGLKEIKTPLVKPVNQPIYLTVKSDDVSQAFFTEFSKLISKRLKK